MMTPCQVCDHDAFPICEAMIGGEFQDLGIKAILTPPCTLH
jgi:hypothetical protein